MIPITDNYKNRCLKLYMYVFTKPSTQTGCDTTSVFFTSLNSEFSFSLTSDYTQAKEPSLPYYLPIAERMIGFIPFPRALVPCEMQSVLSRIWTCVAISISYDDSHYTVGTTQTILKPPHKQDVTQDQF